VYVIGAVKRSGGFVLAEKEQVSALQALSLAEGLDRGASPNRARILRQGKDGRRQEIGIDLKKIMSGKAKDVPLMANDVLFVPSSAMRTVAWRSLEAGMAIGTGWAIYRR
jgi:polysaccharide export outer membrane protein